jgi:epoxyqueuosine reductase QueG
VELRPKVKKIALEMGAAYFGMADLELAKNGRTTPYEAKLISRYKTAISIGFPLLDDIVDAIKDTDDLFALSNYRYHVYEVVNPRINDITLSVAGAVIAAGYQALAVPASHTVDAPNLTGLFSHKMAANLAGLGWIGKSCLLITPDHGPRVRWGTILTDFVGQAGMPYTGKGCGGCNLCVSSCPAGAFTGRTFDQSEPREVRMDAHKCLQYIWQERKQKVGIEACGICVQICPFGHKSKAKK